MSRASRRRKRKNRRLKNKNSYKYSAKNPMELNETFCNYEVVYTSKTGNRKRVERVCTDNLPKTIRYLEQLFTVLRTYPVYDERFYYLKDSNLLFEVV